MQSYCSVVRVNIKATKGHTIYLNRLIQVLTVCEIDTQQSLWYVNRGHDDETEKGAESIQMIMDCCKRSGTEQESQSC